LRNSIFLRCDDRLVQWLMEASARQHEAPSTYARRILEREASRDLQRREGRDDEVV
jgi:hypothetical protein